MHSFAKVVANDQRGGRDDFKVADLSLAEFGRKEIRLAEHEMPGLMAMRAEFADGAAADRARGSPARCT